MINHNFICNYCSNNLCTHPETVVPNVPDAYGPAGLFIITNGGCRRKDCYGYLDPANAKVVSPVIKIETCHTPLTVPSVGANIKYYKFTTIPTNINSIGISSYLESSGTLRFPLSGSAVTNLLSEWYNDGHYPPMLHLNISKNEKWGCVISGSFQAQKDGVHVFCVAGDGYVNLSCSCTLNSGITYNDKIWLSGNTASLSSGHWYDFKFSYMQTNALLGGYTVMYKHVNDTVLLPLTAGACTSASVVDHGTPLSYNTVLSYSNVAIDNKEKSSSTMSFSVPMSVTSGYGYSYNYNTQILSCLTSGYALSYLRKNELIKCSIGYLTNNYYDYVTSFIGHITSISTSLSPDSQPIFNIECEDFTRFVNEALMMNYPTIQTYWLADLMGDDIGIYGYKRGTPAFDAWPINKVYRALLSHAGIDSTLMNKYYEFLNISGSTINGVTPLILDDVTNGFPVSKLERFVNYGNPKSAIVGGQADSEYNFKYGFGEQISDVIYEIADNFGFVWGFRPYNDGAPYLSVVNSPIIHKSASSVGTINAPVTIGTWTKVFDIDAIAGYYAKTNTVNASLSYVISGTSFYVVCPNITYTGVDTYHAEITVTNSVGDVVSTQYINLNNDDTWQFYNGIDNSIGINPTLFKIASGLPYDAYTLKIKNIITSSEYLYFNAFLGYERDVLTPSLNSTILRGALENENPGTLMSLSYDDHSDNMRNDIVVIGKSKGIEARSTPTNEQKYYYVGRGIDLNSIYNPNATNFIGRQRSGMIVNNRITSDSRADFLAYSVLSRYRMPGENVSFEIPMNLRLELGDSINIIDDYSYIVSGTKWVKSITQNFDLDNISTSIATNDLEPYGSVVQKPSIAISHGEIIKNFSIANCGALTNVKYYNSSSNTLTVTEDVSTNIPITVALYPDASNPKRYCNGYVFEPFIQNVQGQHIEGFVLSGYSGANLNIWVNTISPTINSEVLIPYDPYTSEDGLNTYVDISFDLLRRCKIRIDIVDAINTNTLVATLTGDSKSELFDEKFFTILDVGSHTFSWNGLDHFGQYNASCPEEAYASDVNVGNDHELSRPSAGLYVAEGSSGYGKFFVKITYDNLEDSSSVIGMPTIYSDYPIYTKRGVPPWEIMDVLFYNNRTKYFNKESWWRHEHPDQHDGYMQTSITNFDNSNKGIGILIHSRYNSTPTSFNKYWTSHFFVPRTFTYSIKAEYHQLTGAPIKSKGSADDDIMHMLHKNISTSPQGVQGELQQFPIQPTTAINGDNASFLRYDRTKYWINAYFNPVIDDKITYKMHAGSVPNGYIKRSYDDGGWDFYSWLIVLNIEIQDLSGRRFRCREYFTWLGDLDGEFWGEQTILTSHEESILGDFTDYIGTPLAPVGNNWQSSFYSRHDSYKPENTHDVGGACDTLSRTKWATDGDERHLEAGRVWGMFYKGGLSW